MKIIDAHHHFWDPDANYHPWLRDEPMIAFRYGDYGPIRRRFLPEDYDRVSAGWDVAATITMEGEWDPADPAGEALWMQRLADSQGRPAAHVAQAWLDRDDLTAVLKTYADLPLVRSVRHKPRANPRPGGPPGGMTDVAFRDGFKRLGDHGLAFDLQTPWWHLHEAVDLAAASPQTPIILNHAGLPADRSESGLAVWRTAIAAFAALPQARIKISGLGLQGGPWRIDHNREIIRTCIDTFGAERAMFASNFPVDGLCGSFDTIYSGFRSVAETYAPAAQAQLFWRTAAETYLSTGT